MDRSRLHFGNFVLDLRNRQLLRGGQPVDLNARYFDALALLAREPGRLITKDEFLGEVWRGVPVTDEALTQCIRTLRKQLGDDAVRPHFIETVPKHGYRFIAPVEGASLAETTPAVTRDEGNVIRTAFAGTLGAGLAGMMGGLVYGFAASQPAGSGMGATSVLLVLLCVTILIALLGGAGVSFGVALADRWAGARGSLWIIAGGAVGGLVIGALVKLIGLDAFALLIGQAPRDVTGAMEGLLLGGAAGLGVWLASRGTGERAFRRGVMQAALIGGATGALIPLTGGRLMGGSLDLLARSFSASRFTLDHIGGLVGEGVFGPVSQSVTGGFEGALFCGCIAAAMKIASQGFASRNQIPTVDA